MTKPRCVKGWIDIGGGRALRTTAGHHLYVLRTMGGKFVAEVIRKHHTSAQDVRFFDDETEARSWAEVMASVRPMPRRPWWHEGA